MNPADLKSTLLYATEITHMVRKWVIDIPFRVLRGIERIAVVRRKLDAVAYPLWQIGLQNNHH